MSRFFMVQCVHTYIPFFFVQPTGQTPEQILLHNIPKRVESCKVLTFEGLNN